MRRLPALRALAILVAVALLPVVASRNARAGGAATPDYTIQAIRYASAPDDAANLVMGAPHEKINLAMVVWLIRGGGRNILFDSGYHRDTFLKYFPSTGYIRPDEAVKLAERPLRPCVESALFRESRGKLCEYVCGRQEKQSGREQPQTDR